MRIKLSEPSMLQKLLRVLAFDPTVIVTQLSEDEIEVSFASATASSVVSPPLPLAARAASTHPSSLGCSA